MELLENCLFINLDKRVDRLEHVTKQLEMMGINGERFKAVETKDGAIGCTMSHIKCLELAKARGYEQVFICEDDIEFTNVHSGKVQNDIAENTENLKCIRRGGWLPLSVIPCQNQIPKLIQWMEDEWRMDGG